MQRVMYTERPMDAGAWEVHDVPDVVDFLMKKHETFPATARIYHKHITQDNDVTPGNSIDIKRLRSMEGPLYVVVYPGDPSTVVLVLVAIVATAAAAFLLRPEIDLPDDDVGRLRSANNSLSNRRNRARPNGRIPDIFGQVRSIPDLIAPPYKVFESHLEVEYVYMCIGKGEYEITDVREGGTLLEDIVGSSAEIYGPNTSPNNGSAQTTIGSAINEAVLSVIRRNEVNGQVLQPPNEGHVIGTNNIKFKDPNIIEYTGGVLDLTDSFVASDVLTVNNSQTNELLDTSFSLDDESARFTQAGVVEFETFDPSTDLSADDVITITQASYTAQKEDITVTITDDMTFALDGTITVIGGGGFSGIQAGDTLEIQDAQYTDVTTVDLDATGYTVQSVSGSSMVLVNPSAVNSDWDDIDDYAGDVTGTIVDVTVIATRTQGNQTVSMSGVYEIESVNSTSITLKDPELVNGAWPLLDNYDNDRTEYFDIDLDLTAGSLTVNLDGDYTILTVSSTQITLSNPSAVNSDWDELDRFVNDETSEISPDLSVDADKWIGPFDVDVEDTEEIIVNVVAQRGLYLLDENGQQLSTDITVELELDALVSGVPAGSPETQQGIILGSSNTSERRAITIRFTPTFTGPMQVRMRRVTETDLDFEGTVVDEVQWRDLYSSSPVSDNDFGDVTTIQTKTIGTLGALVVKDRQLNCNASRKIDTRDTGETFNGVLIETSNAEEIIAHVLLDPYIGNRVVGELDLDSIYDTVAAVRTFFGQDVTGEFNYTFDDPNLSVEQTVAAIAAAVFCVAYRQANQIKLNFEQATLNSTLLFNHRNKIPRSETRTVRFGNLDNHDGVILNYKDETDGATLSYLIPADGTALNPRTINARGVSSLFTAFYQAYRAWNKIRYQNTAVEFQATSEANLLVNQDRILVADGTRPDVQQGEVKAVVGLVITTSQPVTFEMGETYTVFLQHTDGTVESLVATEVSGETHQLNLGSAPKQTLNTDSTDYAVATYMLVKDSAAREDAFLVTGKSAESTFKHTVTAVNYDHKFYLHDGLILWMEFLDLTYADTSPYEMDGTAAGSAAVTLEVGGRDKNSHVGTGSGDSVDLAMENGDNPTDYSKACWINLDNLTTTGEILSRPAATTESFGFDSSGNLRVLHNGVELVTAAWPAASAWHHAAVTYNATSQEIKLYIDGVEVDSSTVTNRTIVDDLIAFEGLDGRADDLRWWNRELSAQEVAALYAQTDI